MELSCHLEDLLLEPQKFNKIGLKLWALFYAIDGSLAGRAGEESKTDAQGAPPVFKEIANTLSMENVPATKFDCWFRP